MTHRHKTKTITAPSAYIAPASVTRQNRRAHGGYSCLHICACGAIKAVNVNGWHKEHGPWLVGEK